MGPGRCRWAWLSLLALTLSSRSCLGPRPGPARAAPAPPRAWAHQRELRLLAGAHDVDHDDLARLELAEQDLLDGASSIARWIVRRSSRARTPGRSPLGSSAWPRAQLQPMSRSLSRSSTLAIIGSIVTISSWVSWWNTMVSSRFEEPGPEVVLQLLGDLDLSGRGTLRLPDVKIPWTRPLDVPGAQVGGPDNDGVFEVDHPALSVVRAHPPGSGAGS